MWNTGGLLELYLLRHGIAESKPVTGRDVDRRLTAGGTAALHDVLVRASAAGVAPAVIVSSAYVRALETARIAAERLGYKGELLQSPALRPEAAPEELWEQVRVLDAGSMLLVAHEPLLSASLAWMLGETKIVTPFAPATLVRVEFEDLRPRPRGIMQWKLVPTG